MLLVVRPRSCPIVFVHVIDLRTRLVIGSKRANGEGRQVSSLAQENARQARLVLMTSGTKEGGSGTLRDYRAQCYAMCARPPNETHSHTDTHKTLAHLCALKDTEGE